jgi:acyl dehydratase
MREPPEDPPCETCREDILEANQDAARIYMMTREQVIVYRDAVIDINHLAVDAAIERNGIRDRRGCFEKVVRVFHQVLKEKREMQQ